MRNLEGAQEAEPREVFEARRSASFHGFVSHAFHNDRIHEENQLKEKLQFTVSWFCCFWGMREEAGHYVREHIVE